MKMIPRIFVLVLGFGFLAQTGLSAPVRSENVEAELIAETTSIQPGDSFTVALRMKMDPHWHTYWINPGDAGLATSIKWDLPEGFAAGDIQWPTPERIELKPLMNFGYEGEVFLLTKITTPKSIASETITLKATVKWLECKEICLPGKVSLDLTLPVSSSPELDAAKKDSFDKARGALPVKSDTWKVEAAADDTTILMYVEADQTDSQVENGFFFPREEGLIKNAEPQTWARVGDGYLLRIQRSQHADELPKSLTGVLKLDELSLNVNVPVTEEIAALSGSGTKTEEGKENLLVIILFAFLGGMILNLMPCVFPVLSIKILGLVNQADAEASHARTHGRIFGLGVLVSFWVLAGTLLLLRAGGEQIGWGFQLQSPAILTFLAAILFGLGLNLFGLFEIGLSLTSVDSKASHRDDAVGSFMSGILATVVATPCTAPFMGAALGFALTQPAWMSMLVFTALGAGMAFPYVLLTSHPRYMRFLPKPGPWMESLKQGMGFIMMATVIWLLWVLSLQTGSAALISVLGGLLLISIGAWTVGRWGAIHRLARTRRIAWITGLLLAVIGVAYAISSVKNVAPAAIEYGGETEGIAWEKYTPERYAEVRKEDRPVFIDFTAAWCLSCQVNERVAFSSEEVQQRFEELNIAALKADWTQRDEVITKALASYGRNSVPLYVLYAPGADSEPVLLPEIITPQIVLKAVADL